MKHAQPILRIIAALVVASLPAQSTWAAVTTWNNASGGNWSVGANWDTLAAPGTADDARFVNIGTGASTTNNISSTINSLTYAQVDGLTHTTVINPGQTLTVNRGNAGDVLYVGAANTTGLQVPALVQGAGGTLILSGTGDLVIRQGGVAGGAQMATLDLSGLDTVNASIGRLLVAQANAGAGVNRMSGTLILARTNSITLTGASPQVMIQDAGSNANGGLVSRLRFGEKTDLFADVMRLGGQKGSATLDFNSAFSLPSLKLRNSDGSSPVSIIDFGYNGAASSGNNTILIADFLLGTVDISANLINIAQGNPGNPGTGNCTGTLSLGAGTMNVNNLEIGWGNATAGNNGPATGTVNVNNSGLFSTGAVVTVNTQLRLARTNGGNGVINGNLNLNGGVVVANSIVSGGGVSTINVNSGSTLVISNTAGTLATPIRNFSISDATLVLPALNGGGVIAVSNLSVGGSANTINISSVPPIAAYPATFTLINYQNGYIAGTGPLSLGTLPTASPAYSGMLVDVGGGVIQLQLTAGPVVDLSLRWTGTTDGTWDSSQQNWLYQGNPSTFFAGAATLFNDNTSQPNVLLAETVSPGSITVSNNTLPYTFTGSGNIAGASALTKRGTSSLTIANEGVNSIGTVAILAGTLQLGTGGVDGSISAITISNNGALVVNRSGSLALSSAITGTGTLTKSGDGILILSGANTYSGTTTLSGGTLQIDGTQSGVGSLTTSAGTVLAGGGTVSGAVTVGGRLNPGSSSVTGIFKANNGLTLSSGATATFDLNATDFSNPAVNDAVQVTGNLVANNNTITVNIAGTPVSGASYLLFTYSGTLSGSFNPSIAGTHFTATLDAISVPGSVYLNITSSSGADLRWNSLSDSAWDSTATNWFNLNTSAAAVFYSGDTVLLDDTAGVVTGITIAAGVNVSPSVITNNATNNSFTISGAGRISGSASIVKTGPSTMVINTANNFTGTVDVEAGTLQVGTGTALGTAVAGTTVAAGGTLDLNGQILAGEVITVSGSGDNGVGAIINTGINQNQALRTVVMAGDATFGGTATWAINNAGGAGSLSTSGNPYKLTKVGANLVILQNLVALIDPALGDIDIQQGTLEFNGTTSHMGDAAYTNSVQPGGTLSFAQNAFAWNKYFNLNGNGTTTTVNNGTSATTELAGPVELHGDCVFNVGGISLTISSPISGDGALIKNGGSPMILTNVNTYTGDTRINTAALRLNGAGSIASSANVIINGGATLTVTGRVDSTFTVASGKTLTGNGVINGHLIESAGSTVAPGLDAIGALTISNTIALSGTTIMELDEANTTNDVLRCNSTITYGGTLNLVNLGGALTAGSSFKLFNASSYLGTFSSINPPTPGAGQTWNTSALATAGTISVVGSLVAPRFGSITLNGNNLVMTGSNGVASGTYYVRASTNVAMPVGSWSRIATNTFNGSGNFNFTNVISPAVPQRFFLLELP